MLGHCTLGFETTHACIATLPANNRSHQNLSCTRVERSKTAQQQHWCFALLKTSTALIQYGSVRYSAVHIILGWLSMHKQHQIQVLPAQQGPKQMLPAQCSCAAFKHQRHSSSRMQHPTRRQGSNGFDICNCAARATRAAELPLGGKTSWRRLAACSANMQHTVHQPATGQTSDNAAYGVITADVRSHTLPLDHAQIYQAKGKQLMQGRVSPTRCWTGHSTSGIYPWAAARELSNRAPTAFLSNCSVPSHLACFGKP
jgi:hypothetical protein